MTATAAAEVGIGVLVSRAAAGESAALDQLITRRESERFRRGARRDVLVADESSG